MSRFDALFARYAAPGDTPVALVGKLTCEALPADKTAADLYRVLVAFRHMTHAARMMAAAVYLAKRSPDQPLVQNPATPLYARKLTPWATPPI